MKKTNKIKIGVAIFSIFILIMILRLDKNENRVKNIFMTTISPFAGFFSKVGFWFGQKGDFLFSIGELKNENKILMKENLELKAKNALLKDIEKENENLRKEIELAQRDKFDLEPAEVIGKNLLKIDEEIYINKGKKDGVEKGMPVIVGKSVMIGKIGEVFWGSSRVELIFSQKSNVSVKIENEAMGVAKGEFGTSVVVDMIPQTAQVENQDAIVTSGLSEMTPSGLLIGYVKDVVLSPDQLFQKVSVALPYEIDKVRIVWVLKSLKQ